MTTDPSSAPIVTVLGPGEPVVAVVGGIHGDEPSGVRAIERLIAAEKAGDLTLKRAVKCIIANPPALAAGRRYLTVDMNRSFPGKIDGESEEFLAAAVCDEVTDLPTLALHSTHSQEEPFAIVSPGREIALSLARHLPISYLVISEGEQVGALDACGEVVTAEVGWQGTAGAIETAEHLTKAFLRATGAISGSQPRSDPAVFELGEPIEKPADAEYDVCVKNFHQVEAGEIVATINGEPVIAERAFYPILVSAEGYEDIFGYQGQLIAESLADAGWDIDAERSDTEA